MRAYLCAALLGVSIAACTRPGYGPDSGTTAAEQPGEAPPGMVWVPGGVFTMGNEGGYSGPEEGPEHQVFVDGFYMDAKTVTNAQFRAFVEATGYVTVAEQTPDVEEIMSQLPPGAAPPPAELLVAGSLVFAPDPSVTNLRDWSQWWEWTAGANWRQPGGPGTTNAGGDDHPVVHIAYDDAVAYATWAGKRLPTEAEWEFAARGGVEGADHVWGNAPLDAEHPQAHTYHGSFPSHAAAPVAVGSFTPNAFGLYDMSGNVWQWTADWFRPDTYRRDKERGLVRNPTGPAMSLDPRDGHIPARVLRGGSFLCNDAYCRGYRVSARSPGAPDSGASHIGFRTVMTVEQWRAWRARNASASGESQ